MISFLFLRLGRIQVDLLRIEPKREILRVQKLQLQRLQLIRLHGKISFFNFSAERKAHAPLEASGEGSLGVGVHLTKNRRKHSRF